MADNGFKLGQRLLREGWISREQLRQALKHRSRFHWRIGSSLLEMGAISEDRLVEALAKHLGVPAAKVEDLRSIPDEILELVPARVAQRCQAVPFKVSGRELHVAMLDVHNLGFQDEIAFGSGKRVVPHIANEARIFEALERYYGQECPTIFTRLLDRLNRTRYMWADRRAEAGKAPVEEPSLWDLPPDELFRQPELGEPPPPAATREIPAVEAGGGAAAQGRPAATASEAAAPPASRPRAKPTSIPLSAEERARLLSEVVDEPRRAGGRRASEAALEAEQRLVQPTSRDQVGETMLDLVAPDFRRVALFKVRRGRIEGWMHRGDGWIEERFYAFQLSLDEPSAFLNLAHDARFYIGPLTPSASHRKLAECWGGELPRNCLLLPVRLRDRLVTVLFADPGTRGAAAIQLERLQKLAGLAAQGLEHCIRMSKLSRS